MNEAVRLKGQALVREVTGDAPLRAYQDLAVGSRSLRALLRYELVAVWGAALPGACGAALRKWLWPGLFASADGGAVFGKDVVLRHPGKMHIGRGVVVDDGCLLDARGCPPGDFRVEDGALVSRGSILSAKGGGLRIGPKANIGAGCIFYSFGGIEVGGGTMIAALCYVGGGRFDPHGPTDVPLRLQQRPGRGVTIGEDCWIGAGAVLLDGARIGRGSVVAAGAVVRGEVEPLAIVGGVPARPLGRREPV